MNKLHRACYFAALIASSISVGQVASVPTTAESTAPDKLVENFFDALRKGNIEKAYSMMAPSDRRDIRNELQKMSQTLQSSNPELTVIEAKVLEDAAAVVIRQSDRDRNLPIWVAKVGGNWKMLLEHPSDFKLTEVQLQRFGKLKDWFREKYPRNR